MKHILGPEAMNVADDDISIILIEFESNEKTRRIFNKVNRYAKATSRGDNIITSEDDMYAILARWLMSKPGAPFEPTGNANDSVVDWKSNTLADRSTKLTTISVIYESVRLMLDAAGLRQTDQQRPDDDTLDHGWQVVERNWRAIIDGMDGFQQALADPSKIPSLRVTTSPYGLLFKPATQQAFIQALMIVTDPRRPGGPRMSIEEAVERANRVDWAIENPVFRHVTVNENMTINPYNEARRRTAMLMAYLIAGDVMSQAEVEATWKEWNKVRGHDPDDASVAKDEIEDLPEPLGAAA